MTVSAATADTVTIWPSMQTVTAPPPAGLPHDSPGVFIAADDRRIGVAEPVLPPGGHNRDGRLEPFDERGETRRPASVVRHLDHAVSHWRP